MVCYRNMPVDIRLFIVTLPVNFSEKMHPSCFVPLFDNRSSPDILSNKDELRIHNRTQGE